MVALSLAITLASAALVAITVIITESKKDIARIDSQHTADSAGLLTDMARLSKRVEALGEIDTDKLKGMQLDLTAIKLKAGL
jgi:hypothetical protein